MRKTKLMSGAVLAFSMAGTAWAGPHMSPAYTPDLLPPSSAPGECWARVQVPAQWDTQSHTVMTHAPYETLSVTQPKLQSRQESVMVKEASVRYEVRQPTFKTVTDKVLTRPAYEKLTVVPPKFSTVTETMKMTEPRLVWKKGNPGELIRQGYTIHSTADAGVGGQGYRSTTQYGATGGTNCGATCEIWCLVEEPGTSQSFTRRVMSQASEVRRHAVPAQYQTISKQVVADPGGVREVPVPAQFRSITVQDLVDPGGVSSQYVEPKYGTVQGKRMVADERYEWRRVVCQPGTQGYTGGGYTGGKSHSSMSHSGVSHSSHGGSHATGHSASKHSGWSAGGHSATSGSVGYSTGETYTSGGYSNATGGNAGGAVYGSSGTVFDQPAYSGPSFSTRHGTLAGGSHKKRDRSY